MPGRGGRLGRVGRVGRVVRRLPGALTLVLLGAATAVAAVFVHQGTGGLVLALAATAATALALPGGWARLSHAAGWALVVVYFVQTRPEGDYVISADGHGYVLLGAALVLVCVAVATLRPWRPSPPVEGSANLR